MDKIDIHHGGSKYDALYPNGIPTTLEIQHRQVGSLSSGLVMYPEGHARNTSGNLAALLEQKFKRLVGTQPVAHLDGIYGRFQRLQDKSSDEMESLYDFPLGLTYE